MGGGSLRPALKVAVIFSSASGVAVCQRPDTSWYPGSTPHRAASLKSVIAASETTAYQDSAVPWVPHVRPGSKATAVLLHHIANRVPAPRIWNIRGAAMLMMAGDVEQS
jgi:hypothetical protein